VPTLPDAPKTSTFCPSRIFAFFRNANAVNAPVGMAAASSKDMSAGLDATRPFVAVTPSAVRHVYSAYPPNPNPLKTKTSSPVLNRVTSLPVCSTTPATSNPGTVTFLGLARPLKSRAKKGSALRMRRSPAVTVAAFTFVKNFIVPRNGFFYFF